MTSNCGIFFSYADELVRFAAISSTKNKKIVIVSSFNNAKYTVTEGYTTITGEDKVVTSDDIFDEATGELLFASGTVVANKGDLIAGEVLENLKKARSAFRQKGSRRSKAYKDRK